MPDNPISGPAPLQPEGLGVTGSLGEPAALSQEEMANHVYSTVVDFAMAEFDTLAPQLEALKTRIGLLRSLIRAASGLVNPPLPVQDKYMFKPIQEHNWSGPSRRQGRR